MTRNLKSLMARLNDPTRTALEGAAGLCLSMTNYEVQTEHWLQKLLDLDKGDIPTILKRFEIEPTRLSRDLSGAIDRFRTGNSRSPVLSPLLVELVEEAWLLASIEHEENRVRSGHVLLAILSSPKLARQIREASGEFQRLKPEAIFENFADITKTSKESISSVTLGAANNSEHQKTGGQSRGTALDKYTIDLTQQARDGQIDAIVGRSSEVRQMIDILMRRRQNNPILTGEPGVGKTAVVEGLACQIASGDVPPPLQAVSIHTLDLGLLQAGAGVKGEFENRLKSVIAEVKASETPIILFIDEAHSLIGAGGSSGQGDAANLLKPALARGELRTVAATTWSEYKKYFEKDAALTRRFQVVKVEEPTEDGAIVMMRGVASKLEEHHGVRILSSAVEDAVRLSSRYLPDRKLPDKSVSVLDTACARVAVSQCATPAPLEDAQRRLLQLHQEATVLKRESLGGSEHGTRLDELQREIEFEETSIVTLKSRWEEERRLIASSNHIRMRMEERDSLVADTDDINYDLGALREEQHTLEARLIALQGESPLIHPLVDGAAIASVISGWTGIPVGKMMRNELKTLQSLGSIMAKRVVGQNHVMAALAERIQASKAGLEDPAKPIGVFLLVGPSGVGKTETALTLADLLYGGEKNLITINMSEYQEAHTVSSLKGSPPGYVGYGEGGVLTEAVRRKPYSVVLLDEIEKAHSDVMELFYQVFDKGRMEDGEGQEIDFRNTIILLTSNLGTNTLMDLCQRGAYRPDPASLIEEIRPELMSHLKPALLGRMNVIPYYPLDDEALAGIVRLKLNKVAKRMSEGRGIHLSYSDEVISTIVDRCTEVDSGARNVDHILSGSILPAMSKEILSRLAEGRDIQTLTIGVNSSAQFNYNIDPE